MANCSNFLIVLKEDKITIRVETEKIERMLVIKQYLEAMLQSPIGPLKFLLKVKYRNQYDHDLTDS